MKTSNKTMVSTNRQQSTNESKNTELLTILTGETKKLRCHYLSERTDKPVSRVLTLERLSHPALTAAGVTAWAERVYDKASRFDRLKVYIQLTDMLCYHPNCALQDAPSVEHYNDYNDVNRNNVNLFFESVAQKPAKMMTGEDWPNMAVIAAYRAAGRDQEADTLTAARDIYEQRREAEKEAWRKKYAAQQTYYNSPKPKNFSDLTELEKAQYMMKAAKECANEYPEMDWSDILEKAAKRLERAKAEAEAKADTLEATSGITDGEAEGIKAAIKREQNDACISSAERERTRLEIKVGDTVRHNKHEEVATVTAIREAFVNRCDGYRYLYTLDFGQSVTGPFGVDLNGGEFLREAFTPCTPDGRDLLPEPPSEITEQCEQNDACISSAESRRDKTEGQVTISTDGESA